MTKEKINYKLGWAIYKQHVWLDEERICTNDKGKKLCGSNGDLIFIINGLERIHIECSYEEARFWDKLFSESGVIELIKGKELCYIKRKDGVKSIDHPILIHTQRKILKRFECMDDFVDYLCDYRENGEMVRMYSDVVISRS